MTVLQRIIFTAVVALGAAAAVSARAEDCPTYISYKSGSYLKSGSYFYYPGGSYLLSGTYLYHPNGTYLKSGSYFYYENGSYLKSGNYLYYPGGSYLKSGEYYYYDNGAYMKSGSTFYYKGGSYARSGSTLYRQDGTRTEFPVTLTEQVGTVGTLRFDVTKTSETMQLEFDKFIATDLVTARLEQDGDSFALKLSIATGHPNEFVNLRVASDGSSTCQLSGGTTVPREFTLVHGVATLDVKVSSSYDPERVRQALKAALDGVQ